MRIIGGQNRGMKLATPRGREVRPILDRVREALFGILRDAVPGARVADLFAGTGVIGLEALSRGAESCVFIDRDPTCISTIKENVRRTRAEDRSRVIRANALAAFRGADAFRGAEAGDLLGGVAPFDLTFVDPPYRMLRSPRNHERIIELVARLGEPDLLAPLGTLVLRVPADVAIAAHVGDLVQADRRRWGGMKIAFFRRAQEVPAPSPPPSEQD